MPFGALKSDWTNLELVHGLGEDLLPVVSNPNARISAESKMVGIGKTPSRYNGAGEVAGIGSWTQLKTTSEQIDFWAGCEDYGICIQTRRLRAIDIDVLDTQLAQKIIGVIDDFAQKHGLPFFPWRHRNNSSKSLIAFYLPGDMPKRSFKVREKVVDENGKTIEPAWLVEFLATGQQFIAHGTHPSGARYEWKFHNGEVGFPTLTLEQFEELWAALAEAFAIEKSATGNASRKRDKSVETDDPIARLLEEKGLVIGEGRDGQLYIECPWSDEHSSDTGIAQCAYFCRGSNGYERGHFKCLHASHAGKKSVDYEEALGLRENEFEGMAVVATENDGANDAAAVVDAEEDELEPLPPLQRHDKSGEAFAIPYNVTALLRRPDVIGIKLAYDEFRDEVMYERTAKRGKWMTFRDEDYTRLRIAFDKLPNFMPVGRDLMRDCVMLVASENRFDSAQAWLHGIKWDGVERIGTFFSTYLGAEDSPYTRACGAYVWSALAGRVASPGVKADMAPILIGGQGIGKSTAIKAMAPGVEFFTEIDLGASDADNARLMRGVLVAELAELKGLSGRELEAIRSFITRTEEKWTPKYKEFSQTYARRLVFLGTSNSDEILADEHGNRRWLPMRVSTCNVTAIAHDREQLWAEGLEHFELCGVDHFKASVLATGHHKDFMVVDEWENAIEDWMGLPDMEENLPLDRPYLRAIDVMREALGLDVKHQDKRAQMRTAKALRKLGYTRRQEWVASEKANVKAWFKNNR